MPPLALFYPPGHEAHAVPGHPERPERVEAIRRALTAAGWWDPYPKLTPLRLPETVLHAVHSPRMTAALQALSAEGGYSDPDTYFTTASWGLALQAAGGGLSVAAAVWQGRAARGFALTRPPGHHATPHRPMGFCLLNNIALAAEYLRQEEGASRLAIVDLDLHHGNGTQEIFYERNDVFFLSIHQSPLYPGTGRLAETGSGPGKGYTANLPLPPSSGDQALEACLETVIMPLLARFGPEMVLVSAGFDSHWRDPLGNLLVSATGYGRAVGSLTRFADERCGGRIALFLEGGYDLEGGAACALAAVAALLGEPFTDPIGPSPWVEGNAWVRVLEQARVQWNLAE